MSHQTGARRPGVLAFLIADIRGYTSYTRAHGDDAAARLAATFAEVAREAVEAHDGTVIELRGDEALATFTSPRQALRAATQLQTILSDEKALHGDLPLDVGIGLDAGEAVPVEDGYRGDALNFAARLCSAAGRGEILASESILGLVGEMDEIQVEMVDDLALKGIDGAVRAGRIHGAVPGEQPWRRTDGPRALPIELDPLDPIFGRDAEARRLRWAWRMARRGEAQGAVVIGPTGIGKTRLVAEAALLATADNASVLYGSPFGTDVVKTLERATTSHGPLLIVVDDIESATQEDLAALRQAAPALLQRPALVVAIANDDSRAEVAAALRVIEAAGQQFRLGPLDDASIQAIVTTYAADADDPPPTWAISQASGGRPAAVHELASEWARQAATRRLGNAVTRTVDGRSNLRQLESEVASNVIDLQLAQSRLDLGGRVRSTDSDRCPFMGLVSFDVGDAHLFFGRERLVAEMVGRLAGGSFLAVVGPSGSGKSSAVRAGLLPALAEGALPGSERWTRIVMRPGVHPVRELDRLLYAALPAELRSRVSSDETPGENPLRTAAGVLPADARPLVVVDQFEELFTTTDVAERTQFVDMLVQATREGDAIVVAAIRADFYGDCARYPGLAALVADAHVLVGPMRADEYRRTIEAPGRRSGLAIDPALVDALVGEVGEEPGALPLLSTALVELWERREGRAIRLSAYVATGGVRGAVARLAEAMYGKLDEPQRLIARGLFLRLSAGEGDTVVRRRIALAELDAVENEDVAVVVRALTDARLLTVGEGTIEVAHEALLREWPRLAEWIEEDREGRRLREHLASSAREWQSRSRDPAELYRGARLSAAMDWTTGHTLELTETERTFISESRRTATTESERQRRSNRRLRALLALAAVALVGVVGAGIFAVVQARDASHEALVAEAQRLGAQGLTESNLDLSLLLAGQGVTFHDDGVTRANLLSAIVRSPAAIGAWRPVTGRPLGVRVSPDGRYLVVWNNEDKAWVIDASTGRPVRGPVDGLFGTFTADGMLGIASKSPDGFKVDVSTVGDPTPQRTFDIPASQGWSVSPDLSTYSTVDPDDRGITISDAATGALVSHLVTPAGMTTLDVWQYGPRSVVVVDHKGVIDPSDPQAMDEAFNSPAQLDYWPTGATQPSASITTGNGDSGGWSLDAAQDEIAVPDTGDTIGIYDLPSGSRRDFTLRHNSVVGMTLAPDGKALMSAGDDHLLDVWDSATGRLKETFAGHASRVFPPAISQAGGHTTAWSVGVDGQVIEWDLTGDRRIDRPFSVAPSESADDGAPVDSIAVSADGSLLAATGTSGEVDILDSHTLTAIKQLRVEADAKLMSLAFSPDSKTLVVGGEGGPLLQRWDTASWAPVGGSLGGIPASVPQPPGTSPDAPQVSNAIRSIAYSPDGKTIAAGGLDGTIRFWDASSGAPTGATLDAGGPVWHIAFSPDGTRIVGTHVETGPPATEGQGPRRSGRATVWNIADGSQLYTVSVDDDYGSPWTAVFSHDGKTLATGGGIGFVRFWDAKTGAQIGTQILAIAGWIETLDFSADDTVLLAAGTDGTVRLLDPIGGQQLGSALPGGDRDSIATIGPDGRVFVVYQDDGHGYAWDISVTSMEAHACSVPGRTLTEAEWRHYLPDRSYDPACASPQPTSRPDGGPSAGH